MRRRLRLQPSKAQEVTSDGFAVLTEGAQYRASADPPPTPLLYAHQTPSAIWTEKRVALAKKKKSKPTKTCVKQVKTCRKCSGASPGGEVGTPGDRVSSLTAAGCGVHSGFHTANSFPKLPAYLRRRQQLQRSFSNRNGLENLLMDSEPPCCSPPGFVLAICGGLLQRTRGFHRTPWSHPGGAVHPPPKDRPCESLQPDKWQGAAGTKMQLAQNRRGHRWQLHSPRHTVPPSSELGTGSWDGAQAPPLNPP